MEQLDCGYPCHCPRTPNFHQRGIVLLEGGEESGGGNVVLVTLLGCPKTAEQISCLHTKIAMIQLKSNDKSK